MRDTIAGGRASAASWVGLEEPGPHFRRARDARVELPFRLHAAAAEELIERLPPLVEAPRFDARHVRAAEPGALLALTLLAGMHDVPAPALPVPPDALIAPTRISGTLAAVAFFEAVAGAAFTARLATLGWTAADAQALSLLVRELARNALEHAGAPAWAAAWQTAPGELRVAVADAGPGFSGTLKLDDERYALEQALRRGRTRFAADPERGRGLRRVADDVLRWGGQMRVRSRTAALAGTPPWHDVPVDSHLPFLPGVQVEVILPCPDAARPPRPARPG